MLDAALDAVQLVLEQLRAEASDVPTAIRAVWAKAKRLLTAKEQVELMQAGLAQRVHIELQKRRFRYGDTWQDEESGPHILKLREVENTETEAEPPVMLRFRVFEETTMADADGHQRALIHFTLTDIRAAKQTYHDKAVGNQAVSSFLGEVEEALVESGKERVSELPPSVLDVLATKAPGYIVGD